MPELKKILLIDEEPEDIEFCKTVISTIGDFNIETANNGMFGLQKALDSQPDLIILDIIMPLMSGFQVLKELKKERITKNIPVIILTAFTEVTGIESGAKDLSITLGVEPDAYVNKPVEPKILKKIIKKLLYRYPENHTIISWEDNHIWIVEPKLSVLSITNYEKVKELQPLIQKEIAEGEFAILYRWFLTIVDLPKNERWSVQTTFFAIDISALEGSTFGEISIWQNNPKNKNEITLIIDFTKVGSQNHEFGAHILISHLKEKNT